MTGRRWLAIFLILVFGVFRLPMEGKLRQGLMSQNLLDRPLDLRMREHLNQQSFAAALGGFRSLIATILSLEALDAWAETNWSELHSKYQLITSLQPRNDEYWDLGHWHMGRNAASYYENWWEDPEDPKFDARRRAHFRRVRGIGRKYLDEGIKNVPESNILHLRLADWLRREEDFCGAAAAYTEAAKYSDFAYIDRARLYSLARCPGREAEAYAGLRERFVRFPKERKLPTMIQMIGGLESVLNLPQEERLFRERQNLVD